MKNSKKKLFAVALAVCLIAILSFTTLAWFTDSEEVTNTFTIGSIEIIQHEQEHNDQNELVDFTQNKMLLPIVDTDDPASDPNYEEKIVTVENVGKNPAYVQTHIAFPKELNGYLNLDLNTSGSDWEHEYTTVDVKIGDVFYTVFTYRYNSVLEITKTTPELLKGVYLFAEVDVKTNPASGKLEFCKLDTVTGQYVFSGFAVESDEVNILVTTQAVQSEGFTSADSALDSAFGEKSIPWNTNP